MADRRPYLVRLDPAVLEALQRWAGDELRSLNAEIEFLLRRALRDAGRLPPGPGTEPSSLGPSTGAPRKGAGRAG